ncbi:MAG TPA: CopG family ribbon-helix-helix protein [Methanobacterium sp.]|jgi:CopG family nickel-responsive transcriptional regulator|nr:MAG: CopG family ribbon-helix-helix protein [Methanobacterium sp.]HOI39864.1 CopG family ribbon-helix-helix protein [Methanobacterium sp.]HOI71006.1 CopG family ribbon-helix-helix protein [Methanobacterium sp.]HPX77524.1 CopG family ribbon-helix-helix protein [Methanobacterium sp.]
MTIISVSLSEKLLKEIDDLKEELGFSGRSEVIRTSTRMLIADNQEKKTLFGNLNSILILIHDQKAEDQVTEIKHDFEDIINTQVHTHLKDDKCMEIFIMEGDAQRMNTLWKLFQANRKMDYVKLISV